MNVDVVNFIVDEFIKFIKVCDVVLVQCSTSSSLFAVIMCVHKFVFVVQSFKHSRSLFVNHYVAS